MERKNTCLSCRSPRWRRRFSIAWRLSFVDARELLRRYLEQRRELGETELVLDSLSVEEAMRILGAHRPGSPRVDRQAVEESVRGDARGNATADAAGGDWREALRAAGVVRPSVPAAAPPSERSR